MLKNSENNGTEEIGLVTPTPVWLPIEAILGYMDKLLGI